MRYFILFFFFSINAALAAPAVSKVVAKPKLASHRVVYDVSLLSTAGGAASVVHADGKMQYSMQRVCNDWKTETVFSLDIGYELMGLNTTHWKQTTVESFDGCQFDFDVYVRENGEDRKDLSGTLSCKGSKKRLEITLPLKNQKDFPKKLLLPVQQTEVFVKAASEGKKVLSSLVFDGTQPDSAMFMSAVFSKKEADPLPENKKIEASLLKGKVYWVDAALYPEGNTEDDPAGEPLYEVGMHYYDNGITRESFQDYGPYRLISTLSELKRLPDIPCSPKKD